MKKIAVFDIDGTLFRWQLYHELVFELKNRGFFSESEALALDTSLNSWQAKKISWREYEREVVATIEQNITTITPKELEDASRVVSERSGHKIYNFTAKLLAHLQGEGFYTIAVTASQQEIAEPFASRYKFDDCIAAVYERKNGAFTGKKSREIYGYKDEIIRAYATQHSDLTLDGMVAVGDSAGDISMLELAARPIAFNPSEELLDVALEKNWQIVIERKNIAYIMESKDGSVILAQAERF